MRKLTKRERILLGTALVLYAGFFAWQGMVLPARVSLETAEGRKEHLEKLLEESPKGEAGAGGQQLPGRKLEPEEADAILQKLAEDTGMEMQSFQAEKTQEGSPPFLKARFLGRDFRSAQSFAAGIEERKFPAALEWIRAEETKEGVELSLGFQLYGKETDG